LDAANGAAFQPFLVMVKHTGFNWRADENGLQLDWNMAG
jgi:hypothetical protein